jgi:hypothetical protein
MWVNNLKHFIHFKPLNFSGFIEAFWYILYGNYTALCITSFQMFPFQDFIFLGHEELATNYFLETVKITLPKLISSCVSVHLNTTKS